MVMGSQSRSQTQGADRIDAQFVASTEPIQTAGDLGRRLDGWAGSVDKFSFFGERPTLALPFTTPMGMPADSLRFLGDILKLGEGTAAAVSDPTLGWGGRAWGVVQDVGRATVFLGPIIGMVGAEAESVNAARSSAEGIRVSQKGFDIVAEHLAQFGEHGPNTAMLDRLASAIGGRVTGADANFYLHELSE
jgi:hypothetical protein